MRQECYILIMNPHMLHMRIFTGRESAGYNRGFCLQYIEL